MLFRSWYTKNNILKEAQKAKETGCQMLYLDPGWEIAEGTTLWDQSRLGNAQELVKQIKKDYCSVKTKYSYSMYPIMTL